MHLFSYRGGMYYAFGACANRACKTRVTTDPESVTCGTCKKTNALRLVDAHVANDEPMDAAIWIRQDDLTAVWLVEILPGYPDDEQVHEPVSFHPTQNIRRETVLIAGNLSSLRVAIRQRSRLSRWIAAGTVLSEREDEGNRLIRYAKRYGRYNLIDCEE